MLAVSVVALQLTAQADTISYSSNALVQSSFVDFNFGKFDSTLGTLTGVTVTIDFSNLQGSFSVVNNDATFVSISGYNSVFQFRQAPSSGLGYSTHGDTIFGVTTTPDWNNVLIAGNATQGFTIGSGQGFSVTPASIGSGFWSAYESVGGTGYVTFQGLNSQSITTTGSSFTLNSGTAGANTQVTVTYNYSAVPEPSIYALLGAGFLALLAFARRKTAS